MKKERLSSHRDIKSINYTLFNKIIQWDFGQNVMQIIGRFANVGYL
jgi:hypothetical protein